MEQDSELLNDFIVEARAHITALEAGLLRMESGEADDDTLNEIFRAAHSIKGTASFFELHKIVDLAHAIENLFGELREHCLVSDAAMVDVLLAATDTLSELIASPLSSEQYSITEHVDAIHSVLGTAPVSDGLAASEVGKTSVWDLWNQLTSEDGESSQPTAAVDSVPKLPDIQQAGQHSAVVIEDSVRINVSLLNELLNLAGEMVLRRNQLLRIAQEADKQLPQLAAVAKGIDQLTTDLQKKIMKTRMQPISGIFNKFPRVVRDLSRKVGKEVDLNMQGLNVELDRSLIEGLIDPMTHLVRNALDHGIELPEIREKNHKPLTGLVSLRAYHEGGRVIIDVCDDGAGIDVAKIKVKAIQNGIVDEQRAAVLSDTDALNLIMTPGFSTADKVTDISGRGVGMDVVKTNIEKLGGKVEIFSEQGIGTTFHLILPLTLAIISSLIVTSAGQTFVIPQTNVRELLLIEPGAEVGKRIEMVRNRQVLRLRDQLLPLVRLRDILDNEFDFEEMKSTGISLAKSQLLRVLVVKANSMVYGLIVDSIYDTEEVLVKPMSTVLGSCGLYSGVTVLGDGSIAMILDTESLRLRAKLSLVKTDVPKDHLAPADLVAEEKQYLLLFQCSGGEMLGLDLAMVAKVIEINSNQLQKIGSQYYLAYQGKTIRVIRPEYYLPLAHKKHQLAKLYIILPKKMKHAIGMIVEKIYDAVYTTVSLAADGVSGRGIFGSSLINDQVVTLINMYELFTEATPEYYRNSLGNSKTTDPILSGQRLENRRPVILLAEDTPLFLKMVKSYLESDGYQVITACNGREALEYLQNTTVDVVVSDVEMPLMTGIELVRAIRSDENLRHLPVIALTSLTGEGNKEKGLRAGFDIYEYKLDRIRLLNSIRDILKRPGKI